jgi:hypothetical protein
VVYAQTQEDENVVCLIAPYEMVDQEDGTEFAVGEWHQAPPRQETWVAKSA